MDLMLPVKRKWFEQIRDGVKWFEFRLDNEYWRRRLIGKEFDRVVVTLGYPPRTDKDRRLVFPWQGYEMRTIVHEEWDGEPKRVFAIRVTKRET